MNILRDIGLSSRYGAASPVRHQQKARGKTGSGRTGICGAASATAGAVAVGCGWQRGSGPVDDTICLEHPECVYSSARSRAESRLRRVRRARSSWGVEPLPPGWPLSARRLTHPTRVGDRPDTSSAPVKRGSKQSATSHGASHRTRCRLPCAARSSVVRPRVPRVHAPVHAAAPRLRARADRISAA